MTLNTDKKDKKQTIYGDFAAKYFELGLSVVPISPGTKQCFMKGWNRLCKELPPLDFQEKLAEKYEAHNIGLAVGPASGICAFDWDYEGPNADVLEDFIKGILPPSPVIKVGKKGWTAFYKYSDGLKNIKGNGFYDFLYDNCYTVLPPSQHSGDIYYKYVTPDTLLDISLDDLPTLHRSMFKSINRFVGQDQDELENYRTPNRMGRHNRIFGFIMQKSSQVKSIDDLILQTDIYHNTVITKDPKGSYFTGKDDCKKLVERVVKWKKEKLSSDGINWDIGMFEIEENGKKKLDFNTFCEFLEFHFQDIRKDIISGVVKYRNDKDVFMSILNIEKTIKALAIESGLPKNNIPELLERYCTEKKPELLIDIPKYDHKEDYIAQLVGKLQFSNISTEYGIELFKQYLSTIWLRFRNNKVQNNWIIFQGAQGVGKDYFFDYLFEGFGHYYSEISLDGYQKKDIYDAIESLLVAYVPEFDESKSKSIATLKSIATTNNATYRPSYKRDAERHEFRHSFVSSANPDNLLRDSTGNRRFWIFKIDKIDWDYRKIPQNQLIAQMVWLADQEYKASKEAVAAMAVFIADETPDDMDRYVFETCNAVIKKYWDGLTESGKQKKIRWAVIAEEIGKVAKNHSMYIRATQTIMKKFGIAKKDRDGTYYVPVFESSNEDAEKKSASEKKKVLNYATNAWVDR